MLRKNIKMLFICIVLLLCVWGCGKDEGSDSNAGDNEYGITIGEVEIKTDSEGAPYVVVEISFTNTNDTPTNFSLIGHAKAFQNGIECQQIIMDWGDEKGIEECMTKIQPGKSYTVHPAFYLNDLTSDIELVVYDYFKLNKYASKVFSFQQNQEKTAERTEETNNYGNAKTEKKTGKSSRELYDYDSVLIQYYNMLKNNVTAEEFQEMTGSNLIFYYDLELNLDNIGYTFIDIDNNGTDELFIGFVQGNVNTEGSVTDGIFINAFNIDSDGTIESMGTSYRTEYEYLCTDGVMGYYQCSIPFSETYRFFEPFGCCISGDIIHDIEEESWSVWTEGQEEKLQPAEAYDLINEHTPMQITYTPFSQYLP